jgi:peptidylprolyl isomerase
MHWKAPTSGPCGVAQGRFGDHNSKMWIRPAAFADPGPRPPLPSPAALAKPAEPAAPPSPSEIVAAAPAGDGWRSRRRNCW